MKSKKRRYFLHGRCQRPNLVGFGLALLASAYVAIAIADGLAGPGVNAVTQERVAQLIQNALGPYRDTDDQGGPTSNPMSNLTNIEMSLREASSLVPNRLDLRLGIASSLLLQALQTNAPFDLKMKGALAVYKEIFALDTNGFEAPILYGAYTRALGETNASQVMIERLLSSHPQRTRTYLEKFRRLDEILEIKPNDNLPGMMPTNRNHAIVVLGAALETNGTIKAKLLGRLQQGLKLARMQPDSPIILTGGNPKSGLTEAYAMSLWLQQEGIARDRLYMEDRARDTLGNAIYSSRILRKLGATHVTVVTSASHIRRSLADFEETSLQEELKIGFTHWVSTQGDPAIDPKRERVAVYRDLMRASGFWAFPGIQR